MQKKRSKVCSPANRQRALLDRRNLKMASSPQAFVRGSTLQFYEWLQSRSGRSIPRGPSIWICGDCHSGNLGPVADAKGAVEIQIRDFDQTVIGNPNHDLIRLALSLASAARGSNLSGVTTAQMLEHMMEGYQRAISGRGRKHPANDKPECVRIEMRRAVNRTWKHLARERLQDLKPNIPLGKRFWPLSKRERTEVYGLFDSERTRRLVTSLRWRDDDAQMEVLDAAYWMKGCSSLGKLRFAVLVKVSAGREKADLCLIDIKEAVAAAAPRAARAVMPRNHGKRVIEGALHLSPALGERMIAARLLGRPVFVRELMPQDLKLQIEQLTCEEAVRAARFLAGVVGQAHARQMDAATRKEFYQSLKSHRSKQLDAPSWLWTNVVELTAAHETAYLAHCRRYALGADR